MAEKKSIVRRYRNFATVVYPDSAPDNWLSILSDLHVPVAVSPLHDSDLNPTGEKKKPHYHVLFVFEGVKTVEQVQELISQISGVGCEVVQSLRGYARYLCHLDNPEKCQYKVEDVRCLCGVDFVGIIGLAIDRYKALDEMCDFCLDNAITSYADFADYCRKNRFEWWRILCDNGTYLIKEYLKSYRWTLEQNRSRS